MYSAEGRYLHDMLTKAFQSAGVQPRYVQQMSHAQAILSLVSTGLGVAIVPEHTRNACFDNVVFRPIQLGADVQAELHAIWRAGNRNRRRRPLVTSCTASDQSFGLLGRREAGSWDPASQASGGCKIGVLSRPINGKHNRRCT